MSGSNNQLLLVVCALSIFGNVWQMFSGSDSECREELHQLKLKRVAKCPSLEPFDGGDKAGPSCPPCPVLKCNPCDGSKEGEGGGARRLAVSRKAPAQSSGARAGRKLEKRAAR